MGGLRRSSAFATVLATLIPAFFVSPLLAPFSAVAQTATGSADANSAFEGPSALPSTVAPGTTVSCFDYYSFGSVQAQLTAPVASTVSGASITFSGTLENANPYPVVDGALYVKVFKSRGGPNDGNGPDVIDQFPVQDAIVIPANGSVPVSFSWRVPSYAQSGDYKLATFFTTSRKFNLLGLSFTDDVIGNTVPFKIVGEQTTAVAFDKASVTVGGAPFHFAAFPPRVNSTEPITVQALVENTGPAAETADITWQIYQWDAQRAENLVREQVTRITVPGRGSAPVSITVTDAAYPVYFVVGTLSWKDTNSIIGVRFMREGVDRARINFPGITSFPLNAGEENALFSCLHNANETDVPNGRLELTLSDIDGRTIAEHAYAGTVTSAMMGVATAFTPREDYDYAVLDARLYSGGLLVDEAHVVYDCAAIDPAQCTQEPEAFLGSLSGSLHPLYLLVALIFVTGVIFIGLQMRHREPPVPPEPSAPPRL